MIKAEIIADSTNEFGHRLTSAVIQFPRFILAELNTHRVFSKNSASSRAIPFERMVKMAEENPFIPIAWQEDHSGMQGNSYYEEKYAKMAEGIWLKARNSMVACAKMLNGGIYKAVNGVITEERVKVGITKQLCNRLLEPFIWHTVIVTGTEWDNFFKLRSPQYHIYAGPENTPEYLCEGRSWKDFMASNNGLAGDFDTEDTIQRLLLNKGMAEIHMMALAEAMWDAYNASQPKQLQAGEWHIPFGDNIDEEKLVDTLYKLNKEAFPIHQSMVEQAKVEIATARCARVSYMNYEGTDDYEKDFRLFRTLKQSGHMSPFEHCATAMSSADMDNYLRMENGVTDPGWCRNFKGFIQVRAKFES